MRKNRSFIILLSLAFLLLVVYEYNKPKAINWNKTFSTRDVIPFGTSAMYKLIPGVFPEVNMQRYNLPYNEYLWGYDDANLVVFDQYFELEENNMEAFLAFIERGNEAFISAESFSKAFLDSLDIEMETDFEFKRTLPKLEVNEVRTVLDTTGLNKYLFQKRYFNKIEGLGESVGTNGENSNFVRTSYGDGFIYLHLEPMAFSNYYLLGNDTRGYCRECLLKIENASHLLIDDYAIYKRNESGTPFRTVLKNEALRYALYTFLGFLAVYLLLAGRRRQRMIPVVEPLRNTSVDFIASLTRLYFGSRNHKRIAHHRIQSFRLMIRNRFHLDIKVFDEEILEKLSAQTELKKEIVKALLQYIQHIEAREEISQKELLHLNEEIENFIAAL